MPLKRHKMLLLVSVRYGRSGFALISLETNVAGEIFTRARSLNAGYEIVNPSEVLKAMAKNVFLGDWLKNVQSGNSLTG